VILFYNINTYDCSISFIKYIYLYFYNLLMLPKLQQSSLANSLRRDNLASQMQCKYSILFRLGSIKKYTTQTKQLIL